MTARPTGLRSVQQVAPRLLACSIVVGLPSAACSEGEGPAEAESAAHEAEDGHGHGAGESDDESEGGHVEHAAASDFHHASLHHGECDAYVILTEETVAVSGVRVEPVRGMTLVGVIHAPARVSPRLDAVARLGLPVAATEAPSAAEQLTESPKSPSNPPEES